HYLAAPNVPLTQTVGVIALEAIAGGKGYKLMFHGTREHDLALIHRFESGYPQLDRRAWRAGNTGAGWHTPFNTVGIPTSSTCPPIPPTAWTQTGSLPVVRY
ncbi:MAG: hypothetical protein B6I34_11060, partial [Anaerolineaceae bacterium 4572_32.1]